jgi:hypothetical protein
VAKQASLYMRRHQRLSEEGIRPQIDHASREIVGGPQIRIDLVHFIGLKRILIGRDKLHLIPLEDSL